MTGREDHSYSQGHTEDGDSIDLVLWINKILAHWWWFAIGVVLMVFAGWLYLRYATPIYKTTAKLLVVDQQKGGGMLSNNLINDFGGLMGVKSNVDNEVELLKTYDLMREVVLAIDGHIQYRIQGRVIESETLNPKYFLQVITPVDSIVHPVEMSLRTLESGKVELQGESNKQEFSVEAPLDELVAIPELGYVRLRSNPNYFSPLDDPTSEPRLKVVIRPVNEVTEAYREKFVVGVTNKLTSTIDLAFDHELPRKGELILNTLIEKYVARTLEDKNTIADSTMAFIDERLLYVGQELGMAEDRIQVFKQESQLADISAQSQLLLESANEYAKDLAAVESQLLMLDEADRYLADPNQLRVMPSSISNDPNFSALVQNYNKLLLERERLLMSQTEDNPYVINLDQQISSLRQDMRSSLNSSRRQLMVTRDGLARQTQNLEAQIRRVPATERGFIDLSRQQQIKQELYLFLQQKWEETAISKQANISSSKVIDSPRTGIDPISPRKMIILLACILLGLLIPFAILYLRELLNVRISSKEDVTNKINTPIVGEIVNHDEEGEQVVITRESRTPIAEQFRALRTNLDFFNSKLGSRTILFTSSMSGEGKSFVAVNLAVTMALSGKKVVLVEFDLRKPTASAKLSKSSKFGYTNYILQPELSVQEVIQDSGVMDNLKLVSSGPIPPNPAEIILNDRTQVFFDTLKKEFDYIIVDAPPIGVVTDAQLLARYTDTTLYVIRHGFTYKKQLEIPVDLERHRKLPNISLVVNGIQLRRYGGYGYGGYGYGYGYGYYVPDQKKRWWWPFKSKK